MSKFDITDAYVQNYMLSGLAETKISQNNKVNNKCITVNNKVAINETSTKPKTLNKATWLYVIDALESKGDYIYDYPQSFSFTAEEYETLKAKVYKMFKGKEAVSQLIDREKAILNNITNSYAAGMGSRKLSNSVYKDLVSKLNYPDDSILENTKVTETTEQVYKNVKEIPNLRKFIRDAIQTETNKKWVERLKDVDNCDSTMILNKYTTPLKYRREIVQSYLDYKNSNKLEEKASIDWNNYLTPEEVRQFISKDDKVESAEDILYNVDGPWYQKYWCDFKDDWSKRELVKDLANFYDNGHLIVD